jgi:hypothetical protein
MGGDNKPNNGVLIERMIYVTPFVLAAFIGFAVTQTSPLNIGPAGILSVFLLVYGFFLSLFFVVIHAGARIAGRFIKIKQLPVKRAYYLATVIAFVPVLLLALNSLGQLRALDVVLVLSLGLILGFYVLRRTE